MKALVPFVAAALLTACTGRAIAAGATREPAVWIPHEMIVDLHDLPKRYSCDDLWYKFKSVLVAIGARRDLEITPYRCERTVGRAAYSPRVRLSFSMPRLVQGANARWSDVEVVQRNVRLEPGQPARLDASDCELLRQIKATLLRDLGDEVTQFRLACNAPSSTTPPFSLTVQALVPVQAPVPPVAAVTHAPAR